MAARAGAARPEARGSGTKGSETGRVVTRGLETKGPRTSGRRKMGPAPAMLAAMRPLTMGIAGRRTPVSGRPGWRPDAARTRVGPISAGRAPAGPPRLSPCFRWANQQRRPERAGQVERQTAERQTAERQTPEGLAPEPSTAASPSHSKSASMRAGRLSRRLGSRSRVAFQPAGLVGPEARAPGRRPVASPQAERRRRMARAPTPVPARGSGLKRIARSKLEALGRLPGRAPWPRPGTRGPPGEVARLRPGEEVLMMRPPGRSASGLGRRRAGWTSA